MHFSIYFCTLKLSLLFPHFFPIFFSVLFFSFQNLFQSTTANNNNNSNHKYNSIVQAIVCLFSRGVSFLVTFLLHFGCVQVNNNKAPASQSASLTASFCCWVLFYHIWVVMVVSFVYCLAVVADEFLQKKSFYAFF